MPQPENLPEPIASAVTKFRLNVEAVHILSGLDRRILDFVIVALSQRDERLLNSGIENRNFLVGNTLQALRNIRDHDSLRPGFQELLNQCVVLLASYFASGVHDLFTASVAIALQAEPHAKLLDLDLKLTVREAREMNYDLRDTIAQMLASDVSFQDTQSIARAFRDYFDVNLPRTQAVNDVVAGLACRHVIVHNGGIIDRKCLKQLRDASPRLLKPSLALRDKIQFTETELETLSQAMLAYVDDVGIRIAALLQPHDASS